MKPSPFVAACYTVLCSALPVGGFLLGENSFHVCILLLCLSPLWQPPAKLEALACSTAASLGLTFQPAPSFWWLQGCSVNIHLWKSSRLSLQAGGGLQGIPFTLLTFVSHPASAVLCRPSTSPCMGRLYLKRHYQKLPACTWKRHGSGRERSGYLAGRHEEEGASMQPRRKTASFP